MDQERIQDRGLQTSQSSGREFSEQQAADRPPQQSGLVALGRQIGNQAVQRLLNRPGDGGAAELDDDLAGRIDRARGDGQPLDGALQARLTQSMDYDLSSVQIHTSPEANELSHDLGARAFTTGHDIFFREGAFDPHSTGGQELIAHEVTHVVQQGTGAVHGSGRMSVQPPGDVYEQQAETQARAVVGAGTEGKAVQAQPEEELLQEQPEEEELALE